MSPLCSCRKAPKQFKDTFWLCCWQKEQLGELQWGRQTEFWKKEGTGPLCLPAPTPLLKSLMLCLHRTYARQSW